ncbi:hypothetical protein HDU82_004789 [Entophlyctis luteolus]|nr:hypothetical protein HDU82_004789 [Entophlyctis luteolus]
MPLLAHASTRVHQELHHPPIPDCSDDALASLISSLSTAQDYVPTRAPASSPQSVTPARPFHESSDNSNSYNAHPSEGKLLRAMSELSLDPAAVVLTFSRNEPDSRHTFDTTATTGTYLASNLTAVTRVGGVMAEKLKLALHRRVVCENGAEDANEEDPISSISPFNSNQLVSKPRLVSNVHKSILVRRAANSSAVRVRRVREHDKAHPCHAFTTAPQLSSHWKDYVPRNICQIVNSSLVLNDDWDPSARARRRHPYYRPVVAASQNQEKDVEMQDAYEDASSAVVKEITLRGRIF